MSVNHVTTYRVTTRGSLSLLSSTLLLAALCVAPGQARAEGDAEAWLWVETRTPVVRADDGRAWLQLRTFADARLATSTDGIDNLFLRVGPIFDVAPWLFVAVNGAVQADQVAKRGFETEVRAELEPNLRFRLGDFAFNDRNRLELRHRLRADDGTRNSVRYRNQLRASYAPTGQWWIPFLWDELLVDSIDGLNQNRLAAGMGFMIAPKTRLDVGYMLRSRATDSAWEHDHVLLLYLFIDVPDAKPEVAAAPRTTIEPPAEKEAEAKAEAPRAAEPEAEARTEAPSAGKPEVEAASNAKRAVVKLPPGRTNGILRATPDATADLIAKLPAGTAVEITGEKSVGDQRWYEVKTTDFTPPSAGWIHENLLKTQ